MLSSGIKILLTSSLAFAASGCGQRSNLDAMESKDWFKNGVDRFYLAYAHSDKKILEGFDSTTGEKYFMGIGCYGEQQDPTALIEVPKERGSKETIKIPLNERSKLYQFNIIENDESPNNGECKILLGDRVSPQQISNGKDLINKNTQYNKSAKDVAQNLTAAGLACFTTVASALKMGATAVAGGYATVQTGGAAAPLVLPLIVTDVASVASSGLFCMLWAEWSMDAINNFQIGENQKLLGESLDKAAKRTAEVMIINDLVETYNELATSQDKKQIEVAAAMWNKHFVETFNKSRFDNFENGWGRGTKFFNAVEAVQTEYLTKAATYSAR